MANRPTSKVIQHIRRVVLLQDCAGLTDGQLLECFLTQRDDAAFAALVRRHGPMVWGVCRRVLHNHHDAEDAFQATFLVLIRKAASQENIARAARSRHKATDIPPEKHVSWVPPTVVYSGIRHYLWKEIRHAHNPCRRQ